jgi:hypothetical protein
VLCGNLHIANAKTVHIIGKVLAPRPLTPGSATGFAKDPRGLAIVPNAGTFRCQRPALTFDDQARAIQSTGFHPQP